MSEEKETIWDIRHKAYQEMFEFMNWIAEYHKEEWKKITKEFMEFKEKEKNEKKSN